PILHLHLSFVKIGTQFKCDLNRYSSIGCGLGGHIDHVFYPLDLLLDRTCNGLRKGFWVRSWLVCHNLNGQWCHIWELRSRQCKICQPTHYKEQYAQYRCKNGSMYKYVTKFHYFYCFKF